MKSLEFDQRVYFLLKKIPRGKITTYKLLSRAVGRPRNFRQIAMILSQNINQRTFPCYRIVKYNGEMGGYNCGKLAKKKLLQKDGIQIYNNRIKNFKSYIFKFQSILCQKKNFKKMIDLA